MKLKTAALAALTIAASAVCAHAQVTEPRETIAYDGARQIVDTCMTMARAKHWPIAIWVLDITGQPVYFASLGASEVGVTTAKFKAETALRTGNPSEQRAQSLTTPVGQLTTAKIGLFPVAGGIPLMKDGKLIGAVGAGGERGDAGRSPDHREDRPVPGGRRHPADEGRQAHRIGGRWRRTARERPVGGSDLRPGWHRRGVQEVALAAGNTTRASRPGAPPAKLASPRCSRATACTSASPSPLPGVERLRSRR